MRILKDLSPLIWRDFDEKAKARVEVAATLKKVVNSMGDKGKHKGLRRATLNETASPFLTHRWLLQSII